MVKKDKIEESVNIQTPIKDDADADADFLKEITEEANTLDKEVWQPERLAEQKANNKAFKEIIQTEKDILKVFDPRKRLVIRTVFEGKFIEFKVRSVDTIHPIDGFENIGLDQRIYKDLKEIKEEIKTKKEENKKITPEEKALYDDMDGKLEDNELTELDIINWILMTFVYPPAYNKIRDRVQRNKARLAFWKDVPLGFRSFLAGQVFRMIGLDPETEYKLFQVN